jgi:uncharacterized cupin superfamily protein
MYLSAQAISELTGQWKVHFLNPSAIRLNKSLGDAVGLRNIGVHLITIQPGDYSTEYHHHHFEEECIYVLSGEGMARIGDATHRISAGDFIGCPTNGVAHAMQATGVAPLQCLVMGQRLAQDVGDYPDLGKRLYRNNGEWNLVEHAHIQKILR